MLTLQSFIEPFVIMSFSLLEYVCNVHIGLLKYSKDCGTVTMTYFERRYVVKLRIKTLYLFPEIMSFYLNFTIVVVFCSINGISHFEWKLCYVFRVA